METVVKTIGVVNGVNIQVYENGNKLVPVSPICEALGIDAKAQRDRIDDDPILGSVKVLSPSTGKDGKTYQMFCLPLKFSFGWLFRIDSRNVKEEAREALVIYQLKVYDILYTYFTSYMDFVNEKQKMTKLEIEKVKKARKDFRQAKDLVFQAESRLNIVLGAEFEEYLSSGCQLKLFPEDFE